MLLLSLLFSLHAHAANGIEEMTCLHALSQFEYGERVKYNNVVKILRYPDDRSGLIYAWDGRALWRVSRPSYVPESKGKVVKEREVYLHLSGKSEIWNLARYEKAGNGRVGRGHETAGQIDAILQHIIRRTFTYFYYHHSEGGILRPKVMAGCQHVTSISFKTIQGKDMTLAEGAKLQYELDVPKAANATPAARSN
jgi:hypothetical protein